MNEKIKTMITNILTVKKKVEKNSRLFLMITSKQ